MNNIIYFGFIPVIIFLITLTFFEIRERFFHKFSPIKGYVYIFGGIFCAIILIILVIISII
ncbi:hypothetical protein CG005_03355 [Mesoplasma florum]|nr:hypothetical protein CG005_03355 [Mesoplasma florum]